MIVDLAHRAAFDRLVRLWRPMMGWSLLVWATVSVLLTPLSSLLLGWPWLTGGEGVVANEALLGWIFTPRGAIWVLLTGSFSLVGAALHFAGGFTIFRTDLEGKAASLPAVALRLTPEFPELLRLCGAAVTVGFLLSIPLVGGLFAVRQLLLGAADINYYLTERPSEWWYAVASGGLWVAVWTVGVAWVAGRSLLALPSYLDGHRPLAVALERSWRETRGEGARLVRTIVVALSFWLVTRAMIDAAVVAVGGTVVEWAAERADSLWPLLAASGGWAVAGFIADATVMLLGIAYLSLLVTELYYEDTALHAGAQTVRPALDELSERLAAAVQRWTAPRRLIPAVGIVLVASWAVGVWLLARAPELPPTEIVAHRGGPAPAPENTLAALEASVEAGADWSEIDVQLTRDGVPVLVHDADLARVAGLPLRVGSLPYDSISRLVQRPAGGVPPSERRIASLGEFLERARGRIGLAIELKYYGWDPRLADEVVRVIREHHAGNRVMLVSLELRAVRQVRTIAPDLRVGWAAAAAVGDPTRVPADFLALSRAATTPSLTRAARKRGLAVYVWTVNRAAAMAQVIQEGADGIITDRPATAVRVREQLGELTGVGRLLLRFGYLAVDDLEHPPSITGF